MEIQRIDAERPGRLFDDFHDAFLAASADVPGPSFPAARFRVMAAKGFPGARAEPWVVVEDGQVVAGYVLALPTFDNAHAGRLFAFGVRPERRGRGLGSALLAHAVGRLRADGRRLLLATTPAEGVGARAHGCTVGVAEARNVLDLRKADWDALERMLPDPAGYHLERWTGPASPELLPDLAAVMDGMNDAPRVAGVEKINTPVERVRVGERRIPEAGDDCYTILARRTSDGAPAGYTRVLLAADRSDGWGHQGDTTVLRQHRGHRLGLLLKLSNLFWLREREPHLDRVITWNATSNTHMLAINEAMGFELFDTWNEWRLAVGPDRTG
ncbi:GNAT family N-acetyltransferase [Nonomuraea sp. LPB2021202275-12-8]|uniref:GNAT family N-acetyltransferase n=1 Tax=Nonomuraea sp. LPB2021202275-12-8 TaxID=3120159 RepID=UPI00300C936F